MERWLSLQIGPPHLDIWANASFISAPHRAHSAMDAVLGPDPACARLPIRLEGLRAEVIIMMCVGGGRSLNGLMVRKEFAGDSPLPG